MKLPTSPVLTTTCYGHSMSHFPGTPKHQKGVLCKNGIFWNFYFFFTFLEQICKKYPFQNIISILPLDCNGEHLLYFRPLHLTIIPFNCYTITRAKKRQCSKFFFFKFVKFLSECSISVILPSPQVSHILGYKVTIPRMLSYYFRSASESSIRTC